MELPFGNSAAQDLPPPVDELQRYLNHAVGQPNMTNTPKLTFRSPDRRQWPDLTPCLMFLIALMLISGSNRLRADDLETKRELQLLRQQNEQFQRQLQKQQELIDSLGRTVAELQRAPAKPSSDVSGASEDSTEGASARSLAAAAFGKLHVSGEGGLAFFRHEPNGKFPAPTMRVDEAKLFFEAPVWTDTYFFTELNLTTREDPSALLNAGELYLDFENLSRMWKQDGQLNFRVGRLDIPFGEEYMTRDAIDSPLISHSLMDFWGVDEGVELYGALSKLHYVLAVQNGGHPSLKEYNSDKSVTLRLGYDPANWLHLGVSAMRTGGLDVKGDQLSELWFGNGFVRSLGSTNTTSFGANLIQGDVNLRWRDGHLGLAGGSLRYADNDSSANNGRDVYFYSAEAVHHLTKKFYGAARFSEIIAQKGFPVLSDGQYVTYFLKKLTEDYWRLSLGLGYRFSPNLLLKAEYSFNQGRELRGVERTLENLLAAEIAFKF
ncbi:MAG: hypothetical protein EXS30_04685 [Pedosphaera sp.]|nr:hypothetical protein [Pedosphaera sp.]